MVRHRPKIVTSRNCEEKTLDLLGYKLTSSYPGWIKSPHVVTRGILKLSDMDSLTIFIWGVPQDLQDLPKFQISGGVTLSQVKTQSAKICLNFNFWGGGVTLSQVKTQSAKICLNFKFWGRGTFSQVKTQSAKICLNFNFRGWGMGGTLSQVKTQSAKICLNFNFQRGGVLSTKSKLKVPRSA